MQPILENSGAEDVDELLGILKAFFSGRLVKNRAGCGLAGGGGWLGLHSLKLYSVFLIVHDFNQERMDWVGGFLVLH